MSEETSPYLRQHKDNPVHWRPWSPATLAEARELDRPILLSVGYAACHWCHVMAHESFEDAEVADLMNRLYVNIKVDREERPDIDQIYMAALSATGEQGGWPLTMFLTPDAKPFWGGTYFPKQPRYGRPGFMQVLEAIDRAWRDKRGELADSADNAENPCRINAVGTRAGRRRDRTRKLAGPRRAASIRMIDQSRGGLRGAPKFPNAPFMQTLWLSWLETGESSHRDAVLLSLRHMLNGGIYDHIGGGLCRYSTDADWLVPHFEKMLYDNAMLIRLATGPMPKPATNCFATESKRRSAGCCAKCASTAAALPPASMPTATARRALLHVGRTPRSKPSLANDAPAFLHCLHAGGTAWLGRQADRPTGNASSCPNLPR